MGKTASPPSEKHIPLQAPRYEARDFPVLVMWTVNQDSEVSHGSNLVHAQSALIELFRQLENERQIHKCEVKVRVLRPDDLASSVAQIRTCRIAAHNRAKQAQNLFCYECGKPTLLVGFIDLDE